MRENREEKSFDRESKLESYLALNREHTVAEYLATVTDPNLRKALTTYRLSEHSLAIEKGRHRQTWLSREDTVGYVHSAHKMRWKMSCTSSPPDKCMTILETQRQTQRQRHRYPCSTCIAQSVVILMFRRGGGGSIFTGLILGVCICRQKHK